MKIALLTNGIYPFVIGGIQKHSFYLAKGLAKRGISVDIYHLKTNVNIAVNDYFSDEELKYINFFENLFPSLPRFPGHYIVQNYIHSKNIYKQIKNKEYDFIYAQGFTSWYFVKKNYLTDRIISNLHGLEMFQNAIDFKSALRSFLLRIPAKRIIEKSKFQISLGGKLTNILIKNGARKNDVFIVPNAVDEKWILNSELICKEKSNQIQFTFIGRNERRKGIVEIEQVLLNLFKKKLDFHFNFVGLDDQEINLKAKNVKCFGVIRDEEKMKEILDHTDVLVCPSYSEGMPTVILEAMARGSAIIATDVGAVSEMVNDENGKLVVVDRLVYNLETAMHYYINLDSNKLDKQKQNSIEKVRNNFTWELVVSKTIKEIENCL